MYEIHGRLERICPASYVLQGGQHVFVLPPAWFPVGPIGIELSARGVYRNGAFCARKVWPTADSEPLDLHVVLWPFPEDDEQARKRRSAWQEGQYDAGQSDDGPVALGSYTPPSGA